MAISGTVKGKALVLKLGDAISTGEWQAELGQVIGDGIAEGMDVAYDIEDSMIFDKAYEIYRGDVEKYSLGNDVEQLDIEVGGCTLVIESSDDTDYYVEARKTNRFQGFVKDGTLYVKGSVLDAGDDGKIILYVPAGWEENELGKVDVELGAGAMEIEGIKADEINLEVGAGQITIEKVIADELNANVGMGEIVIKEMQVETLQGEVGMGNLSMKGTIGEKADIECAMGSLEMEIEGTEEDFNYDIESGMGNVCFGDSEYSGIVEERNIDNDASKEMTIECAMGEVSISFTE